MEKIIIWFLMLGLFTGCFAGRPNTDSSKYRITFYSGGLAVCVWTSNGKIQSVPETDGWRFIDSTTGKSVSVSGDCVIEQIN